MSVKNILSKRNRALLRELVITDFKLRYQGSVLGYLWSLLKPLFLFAILFIVFGYFLNIGKGIEHFPIYLLLGIVLWGFFVEATGQALSSIVTRGDLIRKVNFPKYIIVVSSSLSALINLAINLFVVFIFLVVTGVDFQPLMLLFPLLLAELYLFALALGFFLAALFVKYRDTNHIWEVGLQALFYATPVIYPVSLVLDKSEMAAKILMLNPMAQIIQDSRYVLVNQNDTVTLYGLINNPMIIAIPFVIIILTVVLAIYYFRKHARYFAEIV